MSSSLRVLESTYEDIAVSSRSVAYRSGFRWHVLYWDRQLVQTRAFDKTWQNVLRRRTFWSRIRAVAFMEAMQLVLEMEP